MLRKILFFLSVFVSVGSQAQLTEVSCKDIDIDCYDIWFPNQPNYHADVESGPNQYLVCKDKKVTVTPDFEVEYLNKTDRYSVEKIEYRPYPYRDGVGASAYGVVTVGIDSRAGTDIDLPFEFCFWNEKFSKVSVHSNGVINLTDGTRFKGNVTDNTGPWTGQCGVALPPAAPTPNACNGTDPLNPMPKNTAGWPNAIAGVSHHYHQNSPGNNGNPNANPPVLASNINWAVYGVEPCRVFVVSFANMPTYNLAADYCTLVQENNQTSQIVLYETTNVIEVNVENSNGCPLDARGRGIIGINNPEGNVAYTAPGRNAQHFDAVNESWRFGPSGDRRWEIEWYVNGEFSGTGLSHDVTIEGETEICARLAMSKVERDRCSIIPEDWSGVIFRPDIDLKDLEIDQQIVCDKNQNTFDLQTLNKIVIDHQGGKTGDKLKFLYYNSEDDAINKNDRITQPREFPINMGENYVWMRIEGRLEECFEIVPIKILKVPVEVKDPKHVNLCSEYTLPPLTDEEFYYKLERLDEDGNFVVETLPQPQAGQLINKIGYYRVSIKKTNKYECEDVKSFILFVENCNYPKGISPNGDGENDYLDLTYNNVVELKIFNRYGKVVYEHGKGYKRQWIGQDSNGKMLPSGTYFLNVKTKNYEYQDWIQLMYELK